MDKHKLAIVQAVVSGSQSVQWAAAKLDRSDRTIKRYVARLRINPADNLIHKNRGRKPVNKIDHNKIWNLYRTKYSGCNILFFCEKLNSNEKIKISEATVRTVFKEHDEFSINAWHRTRNALRKCLRKLNRFSANQKKALVQLGTQQYIKTTHPRRPRCKYFGKELQMDACERIWFSSKNQICTLQLMMQQVLLSVLTSIKEKPVSVITISHVNSLKNKEFQSLLRLTNGLFLNINGKTIKIWRRTP